MKKIEDIERLQIEELEALAEKENARLSEGSSEKIELALACAMAIQEEKGRKQRSKGVYYSLAAAAVCAGLALFVLLRPQPLEDSFSDPLLAREYMLSAFGKIENSMDRGLKQAEVASKQLEKPALILKKIYR